MDVMVVLALQISIYIIAHDLLTDQMILRSRRSTGEVEVEELFSEEEKGVHMSIAPGYPLAGSHFHLCLYFILLFIFLIE